jgi:hypothetical protein
MLPQSDLKRKCLDPSTSYHQDVIYLGEVNDDQNVLVDLERPIGKKAAKEREEKKKEQRLWRERDCNGDFEWISGSEEEIL